MIRICRRCRASPQTRCGAATSDVAARSDLPRASRRPPGRGRRDRPRGRHRRRSPTNFDQMLALQDWFRDRVHLRHDVPPGHGTSAIEAFLRAQSATASSSPGRSRRWPARSACRRGSPSASPRASGRDDGTLQGARPQRPRLARGVVRRVRLGAVRADPGPRAPGAEAYTGVAPNRTTRRRRPPRTTTTTDHGRPARRRSRRRRRRPAGRADAAARHERGPRRFRVALCWRSSSWSACSPPAGARAPLATPAPRVGVRSCSPAGRAVGPRPAGRRRGRRPHRPGADPARAVGARGAHVPRPLDAPPRARRGGHGGHVRDERRGVATRRRQHPS